ncbi:MAG: Ni/Fe hydrogenase subunit beta [Omnitrophica bacterium RIFOXYB12_FULL_50_7]|nr:MAG: Ni/Fe hydrogenase subunit beta [Omnitrophica bacterium RIFOXYB12_FULL_50_7]
MESFYVLKKSDLDRFIRQLSRSRKVVAPVSRGVKNFVFAEVTSAAQISIQSIPTILPPKKYFMPQCEKIQEFNREIHQWNPVVEANGEVVLFGVHTCDLAGIQFLNTVMDVVPRDVNYAVHKQKIVVIGLECNDYCDEYASCRVMKNHLPNGGYDLFLTELKDVFMVHGGSAAGEKIVKEAGIFLKPDAAHKKELEDIRKKKEMIFKDEVNVKREDLRGVFERSVQSDVWENLGGRCVACGNCTNVCPTCYCFDIKDELDLNLKTGCRTRIWDSCQNEEFAKVAGGESFRHNRGQRQRHRFMRKFTYPVGKFSVYACTGCGRCSRTCMAKINLKETINELAGAVK